MFKSEFIPANAKWKVKAFADLRSKIFNAFSLLGLRLQQNNAKVRRALVGIVFCMIPFSNSAPISSIWVIVDLKLQSHLGSTLALDEG